MADHRDGFYGDENGAAEFGLVMPFTIVASVGGPYDDTSFAAGWECGRIDALLCAAEGPVELAIVRAATVPQLDLIAMRHGYSLAFTADDDSLPEWGSASFTPTAR